MTGVQTCALPISTFFLVGFVVYIAFMIAIGIFASRGKSEGTDYLTGGRALNLLLIFGTIGVTMIGTGIESSALVFFGFLNT